MKKPNACSKCVLPSTTPGIHFDENGVCNYCSSYEPMKVKGEEKLIEILNGYRAQKNRYDCIICISGGRDSTYTLWKLVHDYGMNVLAVNYKNPFTSEQASENIKNAVETLGVDLYEWEFPNDIQRRTTKKALKVWSHHPSSLMIPIVCTHCKLGGPTHFNIARDHGTSLMVLGSNPLETASFKRAGLGGARDYHKLSKLPRVLWLSLRELASNPRYLTNCSWGMVLKLYLYTGNTPYLRMRYSDMTVLALFDYLKWDEQEVVSTISENLGWRKSPEVASSWRFDCRLDYVRRLMYSSTVGVTELRDLFSKMIREGMMTREEALARLETEDVIPPEVANSVLSELDMKLSDLNLPSFDSG